MALSPANHRIGRYPFGRRNGKVIIISINTFDVGNGKESDGDRKDVDSIMNAFRPLGYDFDLLRNEHCTTLQLAHELQDLADRKTNEDYGLIIIFFIGHGKDNGVLNTYDGVITLNKLLKPFVKSKSLANKPKLLFFQACRGLKYDLKSKSGKRDHDGTEKTKLPTCDHLLVMCPVPEGYAAFTTANKGSPFIQSLMATIKSEDTDQVDMLTLIGKVKLESSEKVIEATNLDGDDVDVVQYHNYYSTLCSTKHLYLTRTQNVTSPDMPITKNTKLPVFIEIDQDDSLGFGSGNIQVEKSLQSEIKQVGNTVVEKVVNKRTTNGQVEYCVKWLNCTEDETTWVVANNLNCPALITAFNKEVEAQTMVSPVPGPSDSTSTDSLIVPVQRMDDVNEPISIETYQPVQLPAYSSADLLSELIKSCFKVNGKVLKTPSTLESCIDNYVTERIQGRDTIEFIDHFTYEPNNEDIILVNHLIELGMPVIKRVLITSSRIGIKRLFALCCKKMADLCSDVKTPEQLEELFKLDDEFEMPILCIKGVLRHLSLLKIYELDMTNKKVINLLSNFSKAMKQRWLEQKVICFQRFYWSQTLVSFSNCYDHSHHLLSNEYHRELDVNLLIVPEKCTRNYPEIRSVLSYILDKCANVIAIYVGSRYPHLKTLVSFLCKSPSNLEHLEIVAFDIEKAFKTIRYRMKLRCCHFSYYGKNSLSKITNVTRLKSFTFNKKEDHSIFEKNNQFLMEYRSRYKKITDESLVETQYLSKCSPTVIDCLESITNYPIGSNLESFRAPFSSVEDIVPMLELISQRAPLLKELQLSFRGDTRPAELRYELIYEKVVKFVNLEILKIQVNAGADINLILDNCHHLKQIYIDLHSGAGNDLGDVRLVQLAEYANKHSNRIIKVNLGYYYSKKEGLKYSGEPTNLIYMKDRGI